MAAARMDMKYVDIPELAETFADQVEKVFFDGQSLRLEFSIRRFEEAQPGSNAASGKRYPCSRLVLTPQAAFDLINKLQGLVAAMEKQGLIKRQPQVQSAQTAASEEGKV